MQKVSLYPKTPRLATTGATTIITEKLDGSNLCFGRVDGELFIAQRNTVYTLTELREMDSKTRKNTAYAGLYGWLEEHGDDLLENLYPESFICGEWIGMGKIKYGDRLDKRFYMFAKARIDKDKMELKQFVYKNDLAKFAFNNQTIPEYIGQVRVVLETKQVVTPELLNNLFDNEFTEEAPIEGYVVNTNNIISKYVRLKNGVLQPHFVWNNN